MTAKRAFDFAFSTAVLTVLLPVLLLIALAVKFDSPGPVFFRQVRIGRNGVPFRILKFRTMRNDGTDGGLQVTAEGDVRVTQVGKVLRQYKLDELPQFLNVLVGHMSVVGPRPEVPKFVERYPAEGKSQVLSLRPGITDRTSLEYRNEGALLAGADDPERRYVEEILPVKFEQYRRYAQTRTFVGDLRIILRTVRDLFLSRGAT